MEEHNNVILVGMPGSGKSTVGLPLAERLKMSFYDSDDDIREDTGVDVSEWLNGLGDDRFLNFEAQKVQELYQNLTNSVLSTGGSVVLVNDSVRFLKKKGRIIFLDTPIEAILRRQCQMRIDRIVGMNGKAPRFKSLEEVFEYRRETYSRVQDITVQTFGKETAEIVEEIVKVLG